MPDYKETSTTVTQWQRCWSVTVTNNLNEVPVIAFAEERVIAMPEGAVRRPVPGCGRPFNAAEAFPLLNPATNQPTGALMSHSELYQALYSLYMQTAKERDAA